MIKSVMEICFDCPMFLSSCWGRSDGENRRGHSDPRYWICYVRENEKSMSYTDTIHEPWLKSSGGEKNEKE